MAAILALAALVLSGCRVEVIAELELRADGSGLAVVDIELDRELLNLLDDLELGAVDAVEAAVADVDEWDLEVLLERGDGLRLRLEHEGGDPAAALRELSEGLAAGDPGLFADLETLELEPDELELAGTIELAAPATPGAVDETGQPLGPDGEELRELMTRHVGAALVVTMPGDVRAHDADGVEGQTLRWELPVEQPVEVFARAETSAWFEEPILVAAAAALPVLLLLIVAVLLVRRRRA